MIELREIMRQHAKKYPLMQPCDAVKLVYQNEFGGGHLVTDKEQSLVYLSNEYDSISQENDMPLFDDIGNGIVRVHIASMDSYNLSIEKLNEIFVLSSGSIHGTSESFIKKLDVLEEETGHGIFSFSLDELKHYLQEYIDAGIKPVSHSTEYKKAYKPAYRVVSKSLLEKLYRMPR